jgi:hypothetical protein
MKRPQIYYANFVHTPMPRRERFGCWSWLITDGMTGSALASGFAPTEQIALRHRLQAESRCRPESERPETERKQMRLDAACARLEAEGLPVAVRIDERDRVCVRPLCACSTPDRIRIARAFLAITARVALACTRHERPVESCEWCRCFAGSSRGEVDQ